MDCLFRSFDYCIIKFCGSSWEVILYWLLGYALALPRYKEILVSLMEAVLRKVQMHFNMEELQEIDNEAIDDDVRVE